jgi:hypothetical protein
MPPTPTRRLADLLIDGGVDQFIASARARNASWRSIALDLRDLSDGQINVTPETIRNWASDLSVPSPATGQKPAA